MRLKNLLIAVLLCTAVQAAFAQTVNLQVTITAVERSNYSPCLGCGDPSPTYKITADDNGPGSVLNGPICLYYENDPNTIEMVNVPIWSVNNSSASQFTLGLEGFQKSCSNNYCTYQPYNFFTCFPSLYGDADDCQNSSLAVVNFMDSAPCLVHNTISAWCGNFRFYYSFVWTYDYAPTLITQPQSASLCLGQSTTLVVAAATDAYGWNTGQNYQWQVSTSTACPGSNWTDIANAVSSTYTPPQTGGTRLYRCLVTSNCTADYNTQTTISNCAVITYNPIGAPGDPVPPIVSGICGSTVLPGSTHTLDVLTPPSPGAVLNVTAYDWTASGGSPTVGTGSSFTWTAPVGTGTYNINLTYVTACPPNASAGTCVVTVGSSDCNFAYVAPSGVDSVYAGGPDVPFKTIAYALSQLGGRTGMRLAVGTYNESVPLQIPNNLVIDGSYVITNGIWSKINSDSTVIYCSGTQVINNAVAQRVGFISNGTSNWELQDLTIRTLDISSVTANGEGYSNYGILVYNGSSNFQIIRTQVFAGAAAGGTNGVTPAGSGGNGGGGSGNPNGGCDASGCSATSCDGGDGTAGSGGAGGGAGGSRGSSAQSSGCNFFGCGSSGSNGGNGGNGGDGVAGSGYVAGNRPATPGASTPYYIPGTQAASGAAGGGGGGGGSGGGGSKGTDCTCSFGGNADGGAGGNGGGGGLPGSGGWGGGGSFGIYASGAGTSGIVTWSVIQPGAAGTGGTGANGQAGGAGGGGTPGNNPGGSCGSPPGGSGGAGGDGGDGGRGQDGANGLAQSIVTTGGASVTGASSSVPDNYVVGIQYNNAKACIYSEVTLTTTGGIWSLPPSLTIENDIRNTPATPPASSYNSGSSPIVVYATTPDQDITLTVGGLQYASYLKIAPDNRIQPVINLSAHQICLNGTVDLRTTAASHWGTEQEYDWRIYQGANVSNPLFQSSLDSTTVNLAGYAAGQYIVRYRVREGCCGWSVAVFDTFDIAALPVQYTVQGGGNYCPGGSGVPIELSGSQPGIEYVVYYNGVAVDSMMGTGASPLVFANETQLGTYTIQGFVFTGCGQSMIGYVTVGLSQTPTVFNVTGGGSACPNSTSGPQIYLNGSQLGVSYQLFLNGVTPEGNPLAGTGNQLSFGGQGTPGTYTVIGTFIASPYCSSTMADSAVITVVGLPTPYAVTGGGAYCTGDTGHQIGLAQTDTGITYSLYLNGQVVSGPIAGTNGAINFGTFAQPGTYTARGFNSVGCDTTMLNTVTITALPLPVIVGLTSNDIICYGGGLDTISISATSANGSVTYSIDSGLTYPSNNGVFTGMSAGNYYVFVQDDSSCISSYTVNPVIITQPAAPLVVTSIVSNITCNGDNNGSINLQPSGGWGAYTYSWSNADTLQLISGLAAGIYSGSVTDIKGCTVSVSDTIVNPPLLTDSVSAVAVTCAGASNGYAGVFPSGGTPPYTYLWSNFSINQIADNLPGGIYYVIVTDANGCQKRDSAIIAEGLPLVVTDSVLQTNCTGVNNSAIHLNVTGGTGPYTYTWSPAGSTGPDTTNIASGTYNVTVSDHSGCSAALSIVVTNTPALAMSDVVSQPSCFGLSDGSISLIVSGGVTPYSYHWAAGAGSGPNIPMAMAGTYYVTVTDAHGCQITDSVVVNQPAPMYVSGIQKNISCHDYNDGQLLPTGYGGTQPYSYQWYLGPDTTINGRDTSLSPQGPITQNIIQLSGGIYSLVITDANGCQVAFQRVIVNPDSLEIALVKTDANCQSANSGAVAVTVTGGTRPYSFLWNDFVTDSFQANIPGGNYGVVVTDSNGCHAEQNIVVNGQPSPMTVNTSIGNPTCSGGTDGFVSLSVQGGSSPYEYNWSTTPAQTGSVATDLGGGTYYATVSDQAGCQVLDTAIVVAPAPINVSIGSAATSCISSADGYAVVNVSGGLPPYTYQLGSTIQSSDTFTHLAVGVYTLIVTDANHCQGSMTLTINSTDNLSVSLTATPNFVIAKEPVQLEVIATANVPVTAYYWSPLDSLNFNGCASDTECYDPTATPSVSQVYTVVVEDSNGCTVTDTVHVTISNAPYIFIPTAFTPNGDGLNDYFEFDILGCTTADVQIWNRWGELVFHNPAQPNGMNNQDGWDGKLNGKERQYDTYTYQFVVTYFDGHTQTITGTVVVMR